MNLNPKSPFSGKPLSDCDSQELNAWCAKLCGWTDIKQVDWHSFNPEYNNKNWVGIKDSTWDTFNLVPPFTTTWAAAGPLMEREEWPHNWILCKQYDIDKDKVCGWVVCKSKRLGIENNYTKHEMTYVCHSKFAPLAITLAFIVAAEHAKEGK